MEYAKTSWFFFNRSIGIAFARYHYFACLITATRTCKANLSSYAHTHQRINTVGQYFRAEYREITMKKQCGLGLPEMLVVLLLASLLSTITLRQYISVKRQYLFVQSTIEENDAVLEVIEHIRDGVRKAGFTPCLTLAHLRVLDRRNEGHKIVPIKIEGSALEINRMSDYFETVIEQNSASTIVVTRTRPIKVGSPLIIADCRHAEVLNSTKVQRSQVGQTISFAKPLVFAYQSPIYVGEWLEERFFITTTHSGQNVLMYHHNHTDRLTDSIQSLSIDAKTLSNHTLLRVTLGQSHSNPITFDTRVRAQ